MSAWAKLLASSSLAFGTAWDLITHPKTGGGTTYNTGVTAEMRDARVSVVVLDRPIAVVALGDDITSKP